MEQNETELDNLDKDVGEKNDLAKAKPGRLDQFEVEAPLTVEARGPKPHHDIAPASMQAIDQYGTRGELRPVKLSWYQGLEKPQIWKDNGIPKWANGHLFIGDKGILLSDYRKHVLLPEEKFADFKGPDPFIPRSSSPFQDWVIACKGGRCDTEQL